MVVRKFYLAFLYASNGLIEAISEKNSYRPASKCHLCVNVFRILATFYEINHVLYCCKFNFEFSIEVVRIELFHQNQFQFHHRTYSDTEFLTDYLLEKNSFFG
jgi:hypothetical protein